jgi:hypothetical protein
MRDVERKGDFSIPRSVYCFGLRAGVIEVDPISNWFRAFDADWRDLGIWSTEARAVHAIGQNLLRRLYPPGKVTRLL